MCDWPQLIFLVITKTASAIFFTSTSPYTMPEKKNPLGSKATFYSISSSSVVPMSLFFSIIEGFV